MLRKVLEPLGEAGWSTEYLRIGGKAIRGCAACMKCVEMRNGRCAIGNDPINDYIQKMLEADAIILPTRDSPARPGGPARPQSQSVVDFSRVFSPSISSSIHLGYNVVVLR